MYNLSPDTVATPIDVWPETLPQKECIGEISPSSTLDVLPGPPRQEPAKPPSPPPADKSSSRHHMLQVRLEDGAVLARGESGMCEEGEFFIGHLGVGEEWGEPVTSWKTVALPSAAQPCKEVAAGDLHSLFLCQGGMVLSCGGGWEGVLGHGDEGTTAIPRPIAALAHVTIQRVAAGGAHSLAVAEGGKLYSWGWGRHGQLGLGDQGTQLSPRHVESIEGVVQVRSHAMHACPFCAPSHAHLYIRLAAPPPEAPSSLRLCAVYACMHVPSRSLHTLPSLNLPSSGCRRQGALARAVLRWSGLFLWPGDGRAVWPWRVWRRNPRCACADACDRTRRARCEGGAGVGRWLERARRLGRALPLGRGAGAADCGAGADASRAGEHVTLVESGTE